MKLYKIAVAFLLCLVSFSVLAQCPTVSSRPAFPGAQGAGAVAKGGRCGQVIMVTNHANGGAGSFRDCVQATATRTCIFRVGGRINVTGSTIRPKANLTIAGQSAPGGGIQIAGAGLGAHMVIVNGNHVIIRYIKFRKGFHEDCAGGPGNECGATLIYGVGAGQSIADHISLQWTQDEIAAMASDGEDSTLSYSLGSDSLGKNHINVGHPTGFVTQGNSPSVSAGLTNIDFHHNLLMNSFHRNPLLRSKSVRFVSNLVHNKGLYFLHASGGVAVDVIGNKFRRGPLEKRPGDKEVEAGDDLENGFDAPGLPSIYMLGNIGPNQSNASGNQLQMTCRISPGGGENSPCPNPGTPIPADWRRSTPLPTQTHRIIAEPVGNLESSILSHVGASRRLDCNGGWVSNRDSTDAARITQYNNNTGISVSPASENTAGQGGFPTLAEGTPCVDSDLDGMPNEFENRLGLSNSNAADRNGDHDGDGFTNLEEYLDGEPEAGGPGEPPPPPPVTITGAGAIIETPGGRSGTGKVDISGGPERRPFGRGTAEGGEPPPPDGIITVGSRIIVDPDVGTSINVRETPGGTLLGTQPTGAEGTVIDGPSTHNNNTWWNVDFDTGTDGWVGEEGQIVETADAP